MSNILILASCRVGHLILNKYKMIRPENITFIHNHNEFINIINCLKNNNYDDKILTNHSKLKKIDEYTKKQLLKQMESNDIIILELCSKITYYEYENNHYEIASNIYEYFAEYNDNLMDCDFVKFGNTSQKRDNQIENYYFRRDNINLLDKDLFNNIIIGNYSKNKEFIKLIYNEETLETKIQAINMPNNYFQTLSIGFDIYYINHISYSVKLCIYCDSNKKIFIKYYNGSEWIYTNQTVNNNIILDNFKTNYSIGFYMKNDTGDIKTSTMLKETNEFYWNINFNIKSYEIIINELKSIDKTLPVKVYTKKDSEDTFIDSVNHFLNYFKHKKIVIIPNIAIKNNNNGQIIPEYVNTSRLEYINFLKKTLSKIQNCYFFENYQTNDLIRDKNHLNEVGHKIVGKKLEKFLDEL